MLVDTHCHLDFNRFDEDRETVIKRAADAGVGRILNPGINLESSQAAIQLSENYSQVYAAIGVHPNDALSWNSETLTHLKKLSHHPKVKAIGEIGLDYYRDRAPRDLQKHIFLEQLDLASALELPVIIHSRQSMADVIDVLKDWQLGLSDTKPGLASRPGVLHSFSGEDHDANEAISMNFLIGITGPITFLNADDLRELVIRLPLGKVLIETDSPFLSPHPNRGKRNEPANVRLVAEKIAELHQEPYSTITEITSTNASRLFKW